MRCFVTLIFYFSFERRTCRLSGIKWVSLIQKSEKGAQKVDNRVGVSRQSGELTNGLLQGAGPKTGACGIWDSLTLE